MTAHHGGGHGPGLHVLLVEDDPAIAEMYRIRLARDGHAVVIAGDGPSALETALAAPPDLLVLDIRLPGFDGLELLGRLRSDARGRDVLTIVLSNYLSEEMVRRAEELGAARYLVKSETMPGALCAQINELFRAGRHG